MSRMLIYERDKGVWFYPNADIFDIQHGSGKHTHQVNMNFAFNLALDLTGMDCVLIDEGGEFKILGRKYGDRNHVIFSHVIFRENRGPRWLSSLARSVFNHIAPREN